MDRIAANAFLTAGLFRSGSALKSELARVSNEMTTGKKSDTGAAVAGDFSALGAIDHALSRIDGYSATTSEMALLTQTAQSALNVISTISDDLAGNLLRNLTLTQPENLSALVSDGNQKFETAIAALNTRFAERSVFGGVVSEQAPLPDADTILTALETALTGAVTVDDVETAVAGFFDAGGDYETLYQGGPARTEVPIAPGETAGMPATALDQGIRDTLKGLATVALLHRGLFAGQGTARAQLAEGAGEQLIASGGTRSNLVARIGTVEAAIATAQTRNQAEKSALGIARAGMLEADPYETATRLEDLQTRLESLYILTSRLSKLSLTEYL